jgi:hypothetical protein
MKILIPILAAAALEDGLQKLLRVIMLFAFLLAVVLLIVGGWLIKQGRGDEGKMAIVGAGIIGGSVSIATAIFGGWGEGGVTYDASQ